ncbi:MAG: DNA repair protein RecN [Dysgonamonadaceae bacterium]|jgi:DNA repair protein RecN (Recombination protein N)|nr:DNA repair protein RecN [Dysgonamonadaceae bacterium]
MLSSLTIQNYALISKLEIDFSKGLSVITGETGAGKSIILGALSLILGQRAENKSIGRKGDKCLIEGIFDISSYDLQAFFEEKDLEYDSGQCIIRREIWSSGKSRAFINDTPAGLNELKELGNRLIDIHSQHQNLMLGDDYFQLQVLDALTGDKELRHNYKKIYRKYVSLRKKFQELKEETAKAAADQDYLTFQYKQLQEASLKPGEQQELENESETLSHSEEIKGGLFRIDQLLSAEGNGAVQTLKNALDTVRTLTEVYSPATGMAERLQSAYLDVKDLALDIASGQEELEFDPERMQLVTNRLDLLYSLQQKHKVDSTEALIELFSEIEKKLQSIENFDADLAALETTVKESFREVTRLANEITEEREKAAHLLEKQLTDKVNILGMPYMKFSVELSAKPYPDDTGADNVAFLFSANKNIPLKPVASTASGGEISRLMLGIKALIAGTIALPTIIFDEIDTGVSGEIADKMGGIMQDLGKIMQVIAITHLPQIAAKGESHYFVYKEETSETTETMIKKLSQEERIREIAQMLSGSGLSEAAVANAKELLKI